MDDSETFQRERGGRSRPTAATPRWVRGWVEGQPGAVLVLPLGVTLVLLPLRVAAGRWLWDVFVYCAANPCRNRAYRCTRWRAAKSLIRDELNDLGWLP